MVKAFIFDMDGVIIDSEPIHLEVDLMTARHFGIPLEEKEIDQYVGMTNPEMWAIIKETHRAAVSVDEIIRVQVEKKIRLLEALEIEPIAGIRELVQELGRHRIIIGLASSSPRAFIEKVLEKFRIRDFFSCVASGEEVPKGKPAPDVYLEAARLLGVPPSACVVLEDSRNGVLAAKRAGMRCIGFQNPNSGRQDLSAADFVVQSIGEIGIPDLFEKVEAVSRADTAEMEP